MLDRWRSRLGPRLEAIHGDVDHGLVLFDDSLMPLRDELGRATFDECVVRGACVDPASQRG
jgi:hypothetical protein